MDSGTPPYLVTINKTTVTRRDLMLVFRKIRISLPQNRITDLRALLDDPSVSDYRIRAEYGAGFDNAIIADHNRRANLDSRKLIETFDPKYPQGSGSYVSGTLITPSRACSFTRK